MEVVMDTEVKQEDVQTVTDAISEVVGDIPPEEPVDNTELESEQEKPVDSVEDIITDDKPADDEESENKPERVYTKHEQSLYAQKNKWRDRAQGAESKVQAMESSVSEMKGKLDALTAQVNGKGNQEEADNVAFPELEADDPISAGDYRSEDKRLQDRIDDGIKRVFAKQQQQSSDFLNEADRAGMEIYGPDVWKKTIEPAMGKLKTDTVAIQQIMNTGSPIRAAVKTYEIAQEMAKNGVGETGEREQIDNILNNNAQATTKAPVVASNVGKLNDMVIDAIGRCQTEEQVQALMAKLGIA